MSPPRLTSAPQSSWSAIRAAATRSAAHALAVAPRSSWTPRSSPTLRLLGPGAPSASRGQGRPAAAGAACSRRPGSTRDLGEVAVVAEAGQRPAAGGVHIAAGRAGRAERRPAGRRTRGLMACARPPAAVFSLKSSESGQTGCMPGRSRPARRSVDGAGAVDRRGHGDQQDRRSSSKTSKASRPGSGPVMISALRVEVGHRAIPPDPVQFPGHQSADRGLRIADRSLLSTSRLRKRRASRARRDPVYRQTMHGYAQMR